ncbi:hypothetical protein [Caballeronia sp. J97]|nr:hypothetical protein [Caballeronia sp. J97]
MLREVGRVEARPGSVGRLKRFSTGTTSLTDGYDPAKDENSKKDIGIDEM